MCGDHHEYSLFKNQAGYWGGTFVNDGGASEMNKLRDAGVPESVIVTIWRSLFVAMSDEEVRNRNKSMELAYQYMNLPQYTVDKDVKGVYIHDKDEYIGTFYAGDYTETPYMQTRHSSPAYLAERIKDGTLIGADGVKYGADCSSLVTWAWQLEKRARTKSFRKYINGEWDEKADGITVQITAKESYESIAPGDAILKNGHIRLVTGNKGGEITFIEQSTNVKLGDGRVTGMTNVGKVGYKEMRNQGYIGITMNGFADEYITGDKKIIGIDGYKGE